ncbi:hypothetical protein ACTWPT_37325 [Nonomuraea sp. 3N208]|uniref:hypothetical protein n=1 Tax=Nonomuraea sp. 3N208 TaxID=3457421 RepID=UPI003FCFBAAD
MSRWHRCSIRTRLAVAASTVVALLCTAMAAFIVAKLKDIRESTLLSYVSHWQTHIREVLADVRLDRLFVPGVEQVFTRIDEKNEALLAARASDDPQVRASVRGKRPTGPVTKQRIRATIRTVLASAKREHVAMPVS